MLRKLEQKINNRLESLLDISKAFGICEVLRDAKDVRPIVLVNSKYCNMLPDDHLAPMYSFINVSDGYNIDDGIFSGEVSVVFYGRIDKLAMDKLEVLEKIRLVSDVIFRDGYKVYRDPINVYSGFTHNTKTQLINWNDHFCYKVTGNLKGKYLC